jgi:type IV pilus assembly protein PilY1
MKHHVTTMKRQRAAACLLTAIVCVFAGAQTALAANDLKLSHTPLTMPEPIAPNLLILLDDSGSMNFRSFDPPGPNPMWVDDEVCWAGLGNWMASPDANSLFFNPARTYQLPIKADGAEFPNANFHSMRPYSFGTHDASNSPIDMQHNWPNHTCTSGVDFGSPLLWTPFYYRYDGSGSYHDNSNYGNRLYISPFDTPNYANWLAYYRDRSTAARTTLSRVMSGIEPGLFRLAFGSLNHKNFGSSAADRQGGGDISAMRSFEGAHRELFWSWLTENVVNSGGTPLRTALQRALDYFKRTGVDGPYMDESGNELSCRKNYQIVITDGNWNDDIFGPPPTGGDDTSHTLPEPLGGASGPTTYNPSASYAKAYAGLLAAKNTLADYAFQAWVTDLRPDLSNNVPARMVDRSSAVSDPVWNPANDPATWQHVVTYGITMGVPGARDPTDANIDALRLGNWSWGNPWVSVPGNPSAKRDALRDDLWHAAINGRGRFAIANSDQDLGREFGQIIDEILAPAVQGSAASIALTSGTLKAGTLAFSAGFDSEAWSGKLIANKLDANGNVIEIAWEAGCQLTGENCQSGTTTIATPNPAPDARVILSATGSAATSGIAFKWSSLSSAQRSDLNGSDGLGQERLAWLRGERDNEAGRGGSVSFRARASVLGDILNAQPVFVGRPLAAYPDDWGTGMAENSPKYSAFVAAKQSRPGRVYAGANDGMLHAFDDTGKEHFAYVPLGVYSNLSKLTKKRYKHHSFVDATPIVRDVYFGSQWHTVLIGGLRHGGKGLYALDITDQGDISESGHPLLWDHTATTDENIGYIGTAPYVTRLADGNWWAVSGNGYNSASGLAGLLLIRIHDGLTKTIMVPEVSDPLGEDRANGLSGVVVSDLNRDLVGEYAYGGDIFGNVWKFDLSSSNADDWRIFQTGSAPLLADGGSGQPYRPITATPRLAYADDGQLVVVVGTGKFIEREDRNASSTPTQEIYGLFDDNARTSLDRAKLIAQTIDTATETVGSYTVRKTSDHPVSTHTDHGWRLALPDQGERVVQPAFLRSGIAFVPTIIPTSNDECEGGGRSWLMTLDLATGGAPHETKEDGTRQATGVLDLNGDGKVDSEDASGGIQMDEVINGVVLAVDGNGKDVVLLPGSSGTIKPVSGKSVPLTRVSWRDITRR